MIILGIDPGTATTGYGLIDVDKDSLSVINYGTIRTSPKDSIPIRLKDIFSDINELIKQFSPDIMSIEELFFFKNSKTVITVSEARGVLLLAAIQNGLEIFEYTPLEIKVSLTGYGRAEKYDIQHSVKDFLSLEHIPKPDDAADALAVALCHYQHINSNII